MNGSLRRRLGLGTSVALGLGSMIGAGVFVVFAPAAAAARHGIWIALTIAALVALCNAMSSARLAAIYPQSGGTYVYGRERLGPFWGYLAGWSFIVGKIASCSAMALAIGSYAWPEHAHLVAASAAVAATVINYVGIQRSAAATLVIVTITLVVLTAVVVVCLAGPPSAARDVKPATAHGVAEAAGLLFFAFAGFARLATLGEEVREPRRTIPRAIATSLALTVTVYALVAYAVLRTLGADRLASASAPLSSAVAAAGTSGLEPVVRAGAVIAGLGALLALLLGVSRTALAMARDGHLPRTLGAIHPRFHVPHHAEVAVGAIVVILAASVDLRQAIGFSSFAVLIYYLIANASAWTLPSSRPGLARIMPAIGAVGCLLLAISLPVSSVAAGVAVLLAGVASWHVTSR
ncbi:MAG: amino acid permease [Actinomycetota bacterium]|nr:amino acid permease [Actinomycetota bacterium]